MMELVEKLERGLPLYYNAYLALKQLILSGQLAPGERLSDLQLAERLGISKTPVREAIRLLVKEGLLVDTPHRGVHVYNPKPRDIAEIYAIRAALETVAAAFCALNPNRQQYVEKMKQVLEEAIKVARGPKPDTAIEMNTRFHDIMVQGSESHNLMAALEPIRAKVILCRKLSLRVKEHVDQTISEHREIISAIEQGNAALCEKLVRQHILRGFKRAFRMCISSDGEEASFFHRYYQQLAEGTPD